MFCQNTGVGCRESVQVDQDHELRPEDIVATSGSWGGMLFDNPHLGLGPFISWSFSVRCAGVAGEPVEVTLDGVPWQVPEWRAVDGRTFRSQRFAEPAEASVLYGEHDRFDAVHLRVLAQRGPDVDIWLELRGDVDGLGIERVEVSATLRFDGVIVRLTRPPRSARRRVAGAGVHRRRRVGRYPAQHRRRLPAPRAHRSLTARACPRSLTNPSPSDPGAGGRAPIRSGFWPHEPFTGRGRPGLLRPEAVGAGRNPEVAALAAGRRWSWKCRAPRSKGGAGRTGGWLGSVRLGAAAGAPVRSGGRRRDGGPG
jgi:hypothetical protein